MQQDQITEPWLRKHRRARMEEIDDTATLDYVDRFRLPTGEEIIRQGQAWDDELNAALVGWIRGRADQWLDLDNEPVTREDVDRAVRAPERQGRTTRLMAGGHAFEAQIIGPGNGDVERLTAAVTPAYCRTGGALDDDLDVQPHTEERSSS